MLTVEALKEIYTALGGDAAGAEFSLNVEGLKAIFTALGGDPAEVADLDDIASVCSKIATVATGGGGDSGVEVTVVDGVATGYKFAVTIPDGVTEIGGEAFKDAKMSSIVFPEGLSNIGFSAFSGCTNLTEVAFPSTLTSLAPNAFSGCTSLSSVTSLAINPPAAAINSFNNTSNDLVIYVPAESVDAYKAANGWSTYADKIQAIPN